MLEIKREIINKCLCTRTNMMYRLVINHLNPKSNRIEISGKPASPIDLMAFFNVDSQLLRRTIKEMHVAGALVSIRGKNKLYYYINPAFVKHSETSEEELQWLTDLFEDEENADEEYLVAMNNWDQSNRRTK